jgi:hypothetical protein
MVVTSFTPWPLYPWGKSLPVPIVYEVGWAPWPVWTLRSREKFLTLARNQTPAVQPVATLPKLSWLSINNKVKYKIYILIHLALVTHTNSHAKNALSNTKAKLKGFLKSDIVNISMRTNKQETQNLLNIN